jgi:hypothetical protein
MEVYYLDPFENGIVNGTIYDEPKPIQSTFIKGPELKFELDENAHVHETFK